MFTKHHPAHRSNIKAPKVLKPSHNRDGPDISLFYSSNILNIDQYWSFMPRTTKCVKLSIAKQDPIDQLSMNLTFESIIWKKPSCAHAIISCNNPSCEICNPLFENLVSIFEIWYPLCENWHPLCKNWYPLRENWYLLWENWYPLCENWYPLWENWYPLCENWYPLWENWYPFVWEFVYPCQMKYNLFAVLFMIFAMLHTYWKCVYKNSCIQPTKKYYIKVNLQNWILSNM